MIAYSKWTDLRPSLICNEMTQWSNDTNLHTGSSLLFIVLLRTVGSVIYCSVAYSW